MLPDILPDAFSTAAKGPASAAIVCRVAETDIPLTWIDGVASDPRLANVFVFDASSAGHYLREDGSAAFTPRGLDILPMLSNACDAVASYIQQDINKLSIEIEATAKNWKYPTATIVGKLVSTLSAMTKPAEVETLSGLDTKQKLHVKELSEALKADPKQKAKETRAAAARLGEFASRVNESLSLISDERCEALSKIVDEARITSKAAKVFAAGQFDATYLPGTGSTLWRKLWDAAESYSVSLAYKDQLFPVIVDAARCVLCQQDLDAAAVNRLKAIGKFCMDQSQQLAEQAATRLKDATEKIEKIGVLAIEFARVEADLAVTAHEEKIAIGEFVMQTDERLTTVKGHLANGIWSTPTPMNASPVYAIDILVSSLEARAITEESADDPVTRKKLESERDELIGREWLAGVKDDIVSQIDRYKLMAKLEACKKDTATASITAMNTELTKSLVTKAFCDRFKQECKSLGLRTLDVKLESIKGKKAETKFGLRFVNPTNRKVVEIASEGEQRCIALAAFLSELSQASHQSALVFDDPVSSLDYWHRDKIAARLVDESKSRQVIVFTHDAVFLHDLQSSAKHETDSPEIFHLEWSGNMPGRCIKGLPWDFKSADDRFDKLEKEQRAIAKTWNAVPNEEDIQSIRRAYSWLRATLERIVEREIFTDVVFRFRAYVDIKKLNGVIGFTQDECNELQRLNQRCHDVTDAHDAVPVKQAAIPSPDDLDKDIADAKELLITIRDRRKKIAASVSTKGKTP